MSKLIPYEISVNGETMWIVGTLEERERYLTANSDKTPRDIGLIAIALFRKKAYTDYAAVGRVDDVEEEITWVRSYESYEWIDWMAGFTYRDEERAAQLKKTERKLGKFLLEYGFAPDVCLETEPSEHEMQGYINHIVGKDIINGQLTMPEEEDDGDGS